jgi:hypothetical protein
MKSLLALTLVVSLSVPALFAGEDCPKAKAAAGATCDKAKAAGATCDKAKAAGATCDKAKAAGATCDKAKGATCDKSKSACSKSVTRTSLLTHKGAAR